MKRFSLRLLALALMLALLTGLLAACGSGETTAETIYYDILLDENGVAHWEAVEGAVEYEYDFVDSQYTSEGSLRTTELFVQVPQGRCVHVRPVFANGETGDTKVSDFNGQPATQVSGVEVDTDYMDPDVYVDMYFDLKWEDLEQYDLMASLDWDSVRTQSDGSLWFEAAGPRGETLRFVGTGVTLRDGTMVMEPGSRLTGLDAMGRICALRPQVLDLGEGDNWIRLSGGYTFSAETHVDSAEELYCLWGSSILASRDSDGVSPPASMMTTQPNFLHMGMEEANTSPVTLSELTIYYDETTYATDIQTAILDVDFYGTYLEGECYDTSKERYDLQESVYDFSLIIVPQVSDERVPFIATSLEDSGSRSLQGISTSRYTIGDVKDSQGNVLDKSEAIMETGAVVEVTLGEKTVDVALPVVERYTGAQTLHELAPYNNATAQGEVTALVIPVFWQDQPENATEEMLSALYSSLGRVMDVQGNVTDYSDGLENRFSLSGYYDIASYNQYRITSFVTDWYAAPYNFIGDKEFQAPLDDSAFRDEVYAWVRSTYPDLDWTRFDADADGFLDAVILMNAGSSEDGGVNMMSYGYALHISPGYTGENAGTQAQPAWKNFISLNSGFLDGNTLIHEYAHSFGLVDYYDVTYSGVNAVGSYDMQSENCGDWNAYSKYAAGWIQPQVVTGLAPGESAEFTLGALCDTADALVIPAAGSEFDGPFGEYILIDLLTDGGANRYDAAGFGLDGTTGVRITHVSSAMEKRVLTGADGVDYPIGTIHYSNAYNEKGEYLLEVIQAGKKNTFTDLAQLRNRLSGEDLFRAGDVFRAEDYSQFLTDGRMDDGGEFGYTVTVVSLTGDTAVIRVTRQESQN